MATTTPDGGANRQQDTSAARYICPLCYRSASVLAAGVCRRCNVPRVPLDNPQVREDLRAHAQKVLERRQARETATVVGIASVLTLTVYVVGYQLGPLRHEFGFLNGTSFRVGLVPAAIGVNIFLLVGGVYFKVFRKRSAFVILAERAAQGEQGAAAPARTGGADPEDLRLAELLRWLGVRIDE